LSIFNRPYFYESATKSHATIFQNVHYLSQLPLNSKRDLKWLRSWLANSKESSALSFLNPLFFRLRCHFDSWNFLLILNFKFLIIWLKILAEKSLF
jgi:hypothetical protein